MRAPDRAARGEAAPAADTKAEGCEPSGGAVKGRDRARGRPRRPAAGPAPDASTLRDAAAAHLGRFDSTEAGLRRVLERKVDRWAARALAERAGDEDGAIAASRAASRALVAGAVASFRANGTVDDARFASRRSGLDARHGRSSRASRQRLAAHGIDAALAAAATVRDDAHELEAAVALMRKRRLGPFAPGASDGADDPGPDPADRRRALGVFARAGFDGGTARRALALDAEEADALLARLRARA